LRSKEAVGEDVEEDGDDEGDDDENSCRQQDLE